MKSPKNSLPSLVFAFLVSILWVASAEPPEDFLQCLLYRSQNSTSISQVIYTPNNSSFEYLREYRIRYLRFKSPTTPKPLVIVTPVDESQIQTTIYCARKHELQIRVRSGGHDFEGLSYRSEVPFVILDLFNLRSVTVDIENSSAWVESGTTLGEFYYNIGKQSKTLGFPGGYCFTIGISGHLSGGGYGPLIRKYGLAADTVIDARFMDVNGRILDRESMGEDLFWAIRGGGGGNFGIVLAWKVKLVAVPEIVTLFQVKKTLEQNGTKLVHRWQYVAHTLPEDLYISLGIKSVNSSQDGKRTMQFSFTGLFLGGIDRLLPLMRERFPELGLVKEDCSEMSWIYSVLQLGLPSGETPEIMLNRDDLLKQYMKARADYVEEPIPEDALEGIWRRFHKVGPNEAEMVWAPYGGMMSEIPESETPYPHRAGILYMIYEAVHWDGERVGPVSPRHIRWSRRFYRYMTPYVSKNPRRAYVNYRDLDLGVNNILGSTSYRQASIWGVQYFKNNFEKLVKVKTMIDPDNFFKNEQSIPPLLS